MSCAITYWHGIAEHLIGDMPLSTDQSQRAKDFRALHEREHHVIKALIEKYPNDRPRVEREYLHPDA